MPMQHRTTGWKTGLLARWGSAWIGCHWSPFNRRLCINIVPCITWWITMPGGYTPQGPNH